MSNYVLIYYGEPKLESQEAGAKYQQQWKGWVDSIGDAWVNPGTPFGTPKTISSEGVSESENGGSARLTGFSIVKASSMEAAIEMAKACPHLQHGTVDVAEAYEM
jgi:hypothetical protein